MPSLKRCTLTHIHDILAKRKKVLLLKDCCFKKVPSWPELSVKACYTTVTTSTPEMLDYLPTLTGKDQRLPERDFFWTVMYSVIHDQVEQYIAHVDAERKQKPNLQDKKVNMVVSEEYMNELLKFDFQSTKKGRGISSILIQKKERKP